MDNPWKSINLSDYENHMKLDTVMQLQTLNDMMQLQLNSYPVDSVMVLGIAGGNGLEYVDPEKYSVVYGVDINSGYLQEVKRRYRNLGDIGYQHLSTIKYPLPNGKMLVKVDFVR